MPIYAYRCDQCGAQKDVLQKISDAPLTRCTQCGAEAFHKVLTAPAFQLKGNGWYVTDFRDKGKHPKSDAPARDSTHGTDKAAPPAAASAESKPAASTSDPAPAAPAAASSSSDA